jgi:hypothetical protein
MSPYLENALQKAMQDTHKNLSDFLNSKGLMEYYTYYSDEFKKIDLNNYLIVYGLSIFRTDVAINKFFNYLKMSSVFVAAILILILILQYISNF